MLFDLELASISSRQLGQHAAHHLWRCLTQELSAMPGVELTLQQVCLAVGFLSLFFQLERDAVWDLGPESLSCHPALTVCKR